MKKFLSVLLSCTMFCNNISATEKTNTDVIKNIKSAQITNKLPFKYKLLAVLGSLGGLISLATISGAIYYAHSNNKNNTSKSKPPVPETITPVSPTESEHPEPNLAKISSPQPKPPVPETITPVSPTESEYPKPEPATTSLPQPNTTRARSKRRFKLTPNLQQQFDSAIGLYRKTLDNAMLYITEALASERGTYASYDAVKKLNELAAKKGITLLIQDVPPESDRAEMEEMKNLISKLRKQLDEFTPEEWFSENSQSVHEFLEPIDHLSSVPITKKMEWQAEELKWQNLIIKLKQELKESCAEPLTELLAPVIDSHRRIPNPKGTIQPDGGHVVMNLKQFRNYMATIPTESIHILFRGTHFKNDLEAEEYRKAFINEGLLVSTGGKKTTGHDSCAGKAPGHAVYLSRNLNQALVHTYNPRTDLEKGKPMVYTYPINCLTLAALMPDCPGGFDYMNYGDKNQGEYTGYPKANKYFLLCSEFFTFKHIIMSREHKLLDYYFEPKTDEEKVVRNLQIYLLKAGIIIIENKGQYIGQVDIPKADRLLEKFGQPLT